jgi:hypothetical protein
MSELGITEPTPRYSTYSSPASMSLLPESGGRLRCYIIRSLQGLRAHINRPLKAFSTGYSCSGISNHRIYVHSGGQVTNNEEVIGSLVICFRQCAGLMYPRRMPMQRIVIRHQSETS